MQTTSKELSILINQLEDLKQLLSASGLQNLLYAFRQKSEMELCMFELSYNEEEEKWEGVVYDEETDESIKVFRPFSYEIHNAFHKQAKAITHTLEMILLLHNDNQKLISNVLSKVVGDIRAASESIHASSSISKYQSDLSTLLMNFEAELRKKNHHIDEKSTVVAELKSDTDKQPQKLSFGFRYKGKEHLLREVYRKCEASGDYFINPETEENDFVEVLTTKDLSTCTKEIRIGCETKQAVYILDRLKNYFSKLTPSTIEKSGLFKTKEGTPLTKYNVFYTRNTNKKKPPKDYELIDRFFDDLDNITKK